MCTIPCIPCPLCNLCMALADLNPGSLAAFREVFASRANVHHGYCLEHIMCVCTLAPKVLTAHCPEGCAAVLIALYCIFGAATYLALAAG